MIEQPASAIEAGAEALYASQQIYRHGVAKMTPWQFVPNFLKAEFRRDAKAVIEALDKPS